jgi:hypothetical protein
MQHRANDNIVFNRQGRKRPHQLEGAAYAASANFIGPEAVDALTGKGD